MCCHRWDGTKLLTGSINSSGGNFGRGETLLVGNQISIDVTIFFGKEICHTSPVGRHTGCNIKKVTTTIKLSLWYVGLVAAKVPKLSPQINIVAMSLYLWSQCHFCIAIFAFYCNQTQCVMQHPKIMVLFTIYYHKKLVHANTEVYCDEFCIVVSKLL